MSIDGQEQEIGEGQWSQWYHLTFEMTALVKVRAITRVKLQGLDPLELYVDFLQIDPSAPPFWQPVSQPSGFAADLARAIGAPFETVGWACMTMPFKDRRIDPRTFLEDAELTATCRLKLLDASLARTDWRLLVWVESTPDRVQHMMYQFHDAEHPRFDAGKAAETARFFGREIALSDAIGASYREMDRIVGQVVDRHLGPDDTLIVCSDHGFQSFRRGVNLNNWLLEQGYLELREGTTGTGNANNFLLFVDWERTRAYAVGLGMIFLNLQGRESQGIVAREDAPALLDEIGRALLATRDGGRAVVREVHVMSAIHSGPHLDLEADLMPGFEAGYRVGWLTTTGGIRMRRSADGSGWTPGDAIEDNANNWSGDHVSVAQDLVRGVFFCNRKVTIPDGGVSLLDVAPTALSLLGVDVPPEYDRPALRVLD